MSKEYNDIIKEVMKAHKDLSNNDDKLHKEYASIQKDFSAIRQDIKAMHKKIDYLIEIMNNLTIMVLEEDDLDDDEDSESYDTDQTWVPEEDNWLNNEYNEDEEL